MVQEFLGEVVPFSAKTRGMESSFIIYLVYHKMMEFLLISMAGVKKDSIVVADILELISMMSYYVTHVEEFESVVLDYIGTDINNPKERTSYKLCYRFKRSFTIDIYSSACSTCMAPKSQ